jgi:hypothetical protein
VETPDTYRRRAEIAGRAAEEAADDEARRLLKSAAKRWQQLADAAQAHLNEEETRVVHD